MSDRPGLQSVFEIGETIGDGWSWLVMRGVLLGRLERFSDLQTTIGIPRQTLSNRLRHLVGGGLLVTEGEDGRSGYFPTDAGRGFVPCLLAAEQWGLSWGRCPPDRRDVLDHHDHRLLPERRCSACRQLLDPRDVSARMLRPRSVPTWTRQRTPDVDLFGRERCSGTSEALQVIGDRWSSAIIQEAFMRTRRYDDFQRNIGIATNILASRLERLTALGVLELRPVGGLSTRREYRLTAKGLALYPIPVSLLEFGATWMHHIDDDLHLVHGPCGNDLRSQVTCGHCDEVVALDAVRLRTAVPTP